jgi:hypothetical protein
MQMMTDREPFEDQDTIDQYLATIPRPNTAYRPALRTRLAAAPAGRSFRIPRIRWPWTTGISLGVAGAVALSLLLVPFAPKQESPLNPRAVLARALDATTQITPYRATAELSVLVRALDSPVATTRDLGTSRIVYQSAIRDATHWRVNTHVLDPVLSSDHEVAVANGRTVTWYESLTNRAARFPLSTPRTGALLLNRFQHALQEWLGLPPLVPQLVPALVQSPSGQVLPLEQTLQQWIRELDNPRTGTRARVLGQQTVIGRTADVIEVWPLFRVGVFETGCNPLHPSRRCLQDGVPVGRARFWIDHEHGVVLRYQEFGLRVGIPSYASHYLYRVTAITFGSGPTAPELAYRPPARPREATFINPMRVLLFRLGGGGVTWRVPPGFIAAKPPAGTANMPYILGLSSTVNYPYIVILSRNVGFTVKFGTRYTDADFRTPNQPGPGGARGSFLYIQEQRRVSLPGALMAGTRWRAGTCIVYTGTYPDRLHWLALARGHVSLLAVANALGEQALVHWAATRVCPLR